MNPSQRSKKQFRLQKTPRKLRNQRGLKETLAASLKNNNLRKKSRIRPTGSQINKRKTSISLKREDLIEKGKYSLPKKTKVLRLKLNLKKESQEEPEADSIFDCSWIFILMDSARIKNIMNDLLFTFNSQQLTPSIQKNYQTKTAPSSA